MAAANDDPIAPLLQRLGKGLYFDNLDRIIEGFKAIAFAASGPRQLTAWTAESVVADIQNFWDDRPIAPASHERVNEDLGPLLAQAADRLGSGSSDDELLAIAQQLVAALIQLQSTGAFE